MIRHTRDIKGMKISCRDDDFGEIKDIYFDDLLWTVRYIVVDTIRWLPGRKVLISPESVAGFDEEKDIINVDLTRKKIENSPDIDLKAPISRQDEKRVMNYFGWHVYWNAIKEDHDKDPHLRSSRELINYEVIAADGKAGKLSNILIDDYNWLVRYMEVTTNEMFSGKKVLLALDWVYDIDSESKEMMVDVYQDAILHAPTYDPSSEISRQMETELFDYYKKKYYWG